MPSSNTIAAFAAAEPVVSTATPPASAHGNSPYPIATNAHSAARSRFAQRRGLFAVRAMFRALSAIAPSAAAAWAARLITKPPRFAPTQQEIWVRGFARIAPLHTAVGRIQTYTWGNGPAVLVAHAWGGRGTQFYEFVAPLVEAGYRVVAFDAPAHGESSGNSADMMSYASVITTVARSLGHVHAIVGHSFGAACTLLAMRDWGLSAHKLVTIGAINHFLYSVDGFAEWMGASPHVVARALAMFEERHNHRLQWSRLSVAEMLRFNRTSTLVIHDEDDHEVPRSHALELQAAAPNARLLLTRGLGHRRILKSPLVIDSVIEFLRK